MGNTIFDEFRPYAQSVGFVDGSSPFDNAIFWNPPGPSRVDRILASNSDSIDHNVEMWTFVQGNLFQFGTVLVPAGAGYTAPVVDVLPACLAALGTDGLTVAAGDSVGCDFKETILSGNNLSVVAFGGLL